MRLSRAAFALSALLGACGQGGAGSSHSGPEPGVAAPPRSGEPEPPGDAGPPRAEEPEPPGDAAPPRAEEPEPPGDAAPGRSREPTPAARRLLRRLRGYGAAVRMLRAKGPRRPRGCYDVPGIATAAPPLRRLLTFLHRAAARRGVECHHDPAEPERIRCRIWFTGPATPTHGWRGEIDFSVEVESGAVSDVVCEVVG